MGLINNISSLLKNKTDVQKEKLIEKINSIIEEFLNKQQLQLNQRLTHELKNELSA